MIDCRFGVSPVNYPDPDPEAGDIFIVTRYNSEHLIIKLIFQIFLLKNIAFVIVCFSLRWLVFLS